MTYHTTSKETDSFIRIIEDEIELMRAKLKRDVQILAFEGCHNCRIEFTCDGVFLVCINSLTGGIEKVPYIHSSVRS